MHRNAQDCPGTHRNAQELTAMHSNAVPDTDSLKKKGDSGLQVAEMQRVSVIKSLQIILTIGFLKKPCIPYYKKAVSGFMRKEHLAACDPIDHTPIPIARTILECLALCARSSKCEAFIFDSEVCLLLILGENCQIPGENYAQLRDIHIYLLLQIKADLALGM